MPKPQVINYRDQAANKNAVTSTDGGGKVFGYKPTRSESPLRRRIWDRYNAMKDDPLRREAEKQWDLGDKMYRMWAPERDERDWRADIVLPDAFSAVQSHMQETVNQRPRPVPKGATSLQAPLEQFIGDIYTAALDSTEFDQETFKARNASAIRGTAFTREEYRYETRTVKMPTSADKGELKYTKKEIVDYDDVYTRFIDNYSAFFDEGAEDPKYGQDDAWREVLSWDVFQALYGGKASFKNVDQVKPAGDIPNNVGYFKMANDMGKDDVELIHYENKITDTYGVLANGVIIRDTPLPSTHKELSIDVWAFYPIPGQIYGMGIPFIIHSLMEERRSIRNMSLDRTKMGIAKMFIVNDLFDISEEDLTPRPHGLIKMNTNGLPLGDAIQALEYGDTPASSIRMDATLLEDERRAHGMDDRPAMQNGGTATEAAIVKESAQARINLINTLSNWNTLIRLGRKKLSNILLYYPAKRMERINEDGTVRDKLMHRSIKVKGMEYTIAGDPKSGEKPELITKVVPGYSSFRMDPSFAQFMDQGYDMIMEGESTPAISAAIKLAQTEAWWSGISTNPILARFVDFEAALNRMAVLHNENPKDWLLGSGMTKEQEQLQAQVENEIFIEMEQSGKLFMLPGTPHASEAHNAVHLDFLQMPAGIALSAPVRALLQKHIEEEIANNPALAAAHAAMQGQPTGAPGGGASVTPAPGNTGGPNPVAVPTGTAPVVGGDVTAGVPVA